MLILCVTYRVTFYITFLPSSLRFLVSALQAIQKLIEYREIRSDLKENLGKCRCLANASCVQLLEERHNLLVSYLMTLTLDGECC